MAVEIIENQLVKLSATEDFNARNKRLTQDMRQYCQIVRTEQKTMFQVRVTEATGEQLVLNHDFTDNPIALPDWNQIGDLWINDNGLATGDTSTFTAITQTVSVEANSYYVIEVKIDELGYEQPRAAISANPMPDYGNTVLRVVEQAGTYQIYFSSLSSTTVTVSVGIQGIRRNIKVDYVTMYKLTTPVVTLETCAGVLKRTIEPFARELDLINYEVEWLDLPEDCYRVCMTDTNDLSYNYLWVALAMTDEGGHPILDEDGNFIKWFG